jgi:3-phenylpropionate/trans-cinnamate dioxygenase ferredoxin reductase component
VREAPRFDYLLVGGGLAAVSAIDGIRDVDARGSILLLSEESEPPYQRPPLSKEYLRYGELPREMLHVKPEGWYESRGVALELRQRVLALDAGARRVTTARGNEYRGERLLLATGGRPRRLAAPGEALAGVHVLRTVEDAEAIRDAAGGGGRAVLVGAGFVGMELAGSLTTLGVSCVVVETLDRAWPNVLPRRLSEAIHALYRERGVEIRLRSRLESFEGTKRVEGVRAGGERIDCDFAVVGVGMDPLDGLAADAGLAVGDGVRVDAFGESSHPHVYAAGDVARHPDPVFGGTTRTEHWEHAREQGRRTGRNMAGEREPYDLVPHFFSEAFEWKLAALGRPAAADRVVMRGTPGAGPSIAFCEREGRLCGIVLVDDPGSLEACRALVRERAPVADREAALADPDVPLEAIARDGTGVDGGADGDGTGKKGGRR